MDWAAKNPLKRKADAAELWLELTDRTEPPAMPVKEASADLLLRDFFKVAETTVGEIAARGLPPKEEETPDITAQAMADGEAQAAQQQQQMAAEQAAAQPAPKPKAKKKPKKDEDKKPKDDKKDEKSHGVQVNVHVGGEKKETKGSEKKASAPVVGTGLGAAGAGTLAAGMQYLKSKERLGGKSREEISREESLTKLKNTSENEGKSGALSKLKKRYAEMQLEQAKKNKKNPGRAALLASILPAVAGGAVGYAGGKALS